MATPYQGVTDDPRGLQSPVGSPDFGFLQQNLMRSNQQYEAGEQKVVGDYSNIVNQATLGTEAADRKKTYINQIQEGLKKVASTDLSLPKNTAQAENLYSPFWKDDDLLTNIGLTKQYQNETSKLDSWENSTDKDTRAQYNKYSRLDIQNGMQQVANSPLDRNAYNKLERRQATPFYDINADVDAAWQKEQGTGKENGISTVTDNGFGAMLTEFNGIKSKDAYKTYYLSKLASGKYDPQIQVMARVQNEQSKSEILRQNSNLSEQQVNQQFANESMDRLGSAYKKTADSYTEQGAFWDKKYKDLVIQANAKQKGILNPEQEGNLRYYAEQRKGYNDQANNYSQKYWNDYSPVTINGRPNSNYDKNLQDLAEHPNDHIAALQRDQMADNWASGRASISSEKKELDPVWAEYQKIAYQKDQLAVDRQRIGAELRGQTLDYEGKTGHTLQGQQLPGFNPDRDKGWYGAVSDDVTGSGSGSGASSGRVIGEHTIEPGKLPTGLDIMQQTLNNKESLVADAIYNPDKGGISNVVLSKLGMSQNDIIDFTEAQKIAMSGNGPSPEGKLATQKVEKVLQEHGIDMSNVHGPRALMTVLSTYSSSVAKQLISSDKEEERYQGANLANSIQQANHTRDAFITSQKNFDNALHHELTNNPRYNQIINRGTGKEYTTSDMAPDFPSVTVQTATGTKTLSPVDVATLHKNGKELNQIDGIVAVNGQPSYTYKDEDLVEHTIMHGGGSLDNLSNRITSKYGNASDIANLRQQAAEHVASGLNEFKNGIIAKEIAYDPNSPNKKEANFALNLAPELSNPGNTEGKPYSYSSSNNSKDQLSPDQETVLRNTLSNIADVKAHVGSISKTLNDAGQRVYIVHFKQPSDVSESSLKFELAGKTVYLPESSNAQGPNMAAIPENSGLYIYGDMYEGKSRQSDPTVSATGISWNWKTYAKNSLGQATKSAIEINRTVPDPNNPGKTLQLPLVQATIPMSGPDAKNPDEIHAGLDRQVTNHIAEYKQNTYTAHRNITQGKHVSQVESEINSQR